jgi:sugar phosphate isomerase/epimerase
MKIGVEGNHIAQVKLLGPMGALDFVKEQGLDGVFFKMITHLSPTLDLGEIRDVKTYADSLGLYLECGVGRINPYNIPESPDICALGGGDYRLALERMIKAARSIDCVELWAECATSENKPYPGIFGVDRFRTDVTWQDQLLATEKFLRLLAPILRDLGCRIDVETHEEITSYEVVRLVEAVGPDVVGITFDTGNVLPRGEDPVAAAHRVAPYTHQTHVKDGILFFDEEGLVRQMKPCGQGITNWETILPILWKYSPALNLSIEDYKGLLPLQIYNPYWRDRHPDLDVGELLELVRLAIQCEKKIVAGEIPTPIQYEATPYDDERIERLQSSLAYLRGVIKAKGLA